VFRFRRGKKRLRLARDIKPQVASHHGMQQFRNRTVTGLKRLRAGREGKWIRINPQNSPPRDIKGFSEVFNPLIALGINPCAKRVAKILSTAAPRPL
jgi:hypothetical protein